MCYCATKESYKTYYTIFHKYIDFIRKKTNNLLSYIGNGYKNKANEKKYNARQIANVKNYQIN